MGWNERIGELRTAQADLRRAFGAARVALDTPTIGAEDYATAVKAAERAQRFFVKLRRPLLKERGATLKSAEGDVAQAAALEAYRLFTVEFFDWAGSSRNP
jgi:hypothetical protein